MSPEARPGKRGKRGKHAHPGARMMKAVEQLDLTDDQRSQLEALKAEHRPEGKRGKQGRKGKRGGGERVDLFSDTVDREAAHAQLDARYAERLERAHTQLDRALDVLSILTPEQRAELKVSMKPEGRPGR